MSRELLTCSSATSLPAYPARRARHPIGLGSRWHQMGVGTHDGASGAADNGRHAEFIDRGGPNQPGPPSADTLTWLSDARQGSSPTPSCSTSFASLLKHWRLMCGLSQEALAERASMSVRGLSDLERGVRRAPQPSTIDRLSAGARPGRRRARGLRRGGARRHYRQHPSRRSRRRHRVPPRARRGPPPGSVAALPGFRRGCTTRSARGGGIGPGAGCGHPTASGRGVTKGAIA